MFRLLGGILGFLVGIILLGPPGMILGPIIGSAIGGAFSSSLFGSNDTNTNRKGAEDAYRNFYEQFYRQNTQRRSYSGYTGFQSPGVSDSCYNNLGCSRSDSKEDIKKNYRKLVSKYHPDRLSGRGLSSSEVASAEAKFKTIQDSYDQIKKEKGI